MTLAPKVADTGGHGINAGGAGVSADADMTLAVKRALIEDLRDTKLSRVQVAEELTALLGRTITEHQVDAFAAESKVGHRFPAELIAAWVRVTGSRRLLDLICGAAGYWAASAADREFAELARLQIQQERLRQDVERRRSELWTKA